jgi:DNA-binding MarR family transcriptional regulator
MVKATSGWRVTSVDRELADVLLAVVQNSQRSLQRGVDRVTITVLYDVRRLSPVRPSELAEAMHLNLSTVSRHISALVARGLLERTPDPADARAQIVRLTPEGEAVFTASRDTRAGAIGAAVGNWSATDRRHLVELLERLAHDLTTERTR